MLYAIYADINTRKLDEQMMSRLAERNARNRKDPDHPDYEAETGR